MLTLNSTVLALNRDDGCMHMGRITHFMDGKNVTVRFRSSTKSQEVPIHLCVPVKGLRTDNSLELDDPVLVRMQNIRTGVQCWVPGHVASAARFYPNKCEPLNWSYSIQLFYGSRRLFKSRDVVKVSSKLHDAIVNCIINSTSDDRGNCMQATNEKLKPPRSVMLKRKKYIGKSSEGSKNFLSVPSTPLKEKSIGLENPLTPLANRGDPIQDSSRRHLSNLGKSSRISSAVSRQNRVAMHTGDKDGSGRYRQSISPSKRVEDLRERTESPDGLRTGAANFRTSSTNPPSDYADYFADGYEDIDEWDRTQPLTSLVFGPPDLEKETVAGQEDAKIVMDLPKVKCRLTVSASINQSKNPSKTSADSKVVDVTLFLEGKRGSYQQTVNLAIPDEDSQRSESGNLAISTKEGQGSGGSRVVKEQKKAAKDKRASIYRAANLAISNEDGQKRGESGPLTGTVKVAAGNRGVHQPTVDPVIADESVQKSGGSSSSKLVKRDAEGPKKSYQQEISLTISEEDGQRSGGSKIVEVVRNAAESEGGPYRLSVNLALSDQDGQTSDKSGVLKRAKKAFEVPFSEMNLVNVEQFWIQESDERYVVTDDYEESRSGGEPTLCMEEGSIAVNCLRDQPVCLYASMDWIPDDKCVLQVSSLRWMEASMIGEECAMEPLADAARNSAHAVEEISMAPNHEVCLIERMSSYSAFNFLVKCLTTERRLLNVVKKLASFSGEWLVTKTLEVVECVNRLQLIFVEAHALQSSVKANSNLHGGREVSLKSLRVLEAGNNSSTSLNEILQNLRAFCQDGTEQLLEMESDHRTSQFSGRIQSQELTDEVMKDNQFIESSNDLEPYPPITAQSVSDLERRLHSAFLTPRQCRISAVS
ncbi:hypothetical protein TcWFU_009274 [Taenia crassiceps]|uniref:Uncharacterized protein n=1 Tax=Taenia crassiceps TaxID=6207 RepID=A0ABR4Q3W3_9CEST